MSWGISAHRHTCCWQVCDIVTRSHSYFTRLISLVLLRYKKVMVTYTIVNMCETLKLQLWEKAWVQDRGSKCVEGNEVLCTCRMDSVGDMTPTMTWKKQCIAPISEKLSKGNIPLKNKNNTRLDMTQLRTP